MADALIEVKNAILALSNPRETNRANDWLVEYEKQPAAWEASVRLLDEDPRSQFRFYGAKFLYSKIKRQFFQLRDDSTIKSLTNTLVTYLLRISTEKPIDLKVCRYICLSISVLALQINQQGIVNQILAWLNPIVASNPRIILQLLVVLPEECYNNQVDIDRNQREMFSQQLSSSSDHILSFLEFLWNSGDGETKLQILNCLENWIKFTKINTQALLNQAFFIKAMNSSVEDDLFLESTVDLVVSMILTYRLESNEITVLILNYSLSLKPIWNKKILSLGNDLDEDNLHVCQTISRLFSELGETYIDILISNDVSVLKYQTEIISQLIECARFPHDLNVSRIPLKFFYELSVIIENSQESEMLRRRFSQTFFMIMQICIEQLKIPSDMLYGNQKISDELSDKRYEWSDTMIDCANVLGSDVCLQQFIALLSSEYEKISRGQSNDWSTVEAILFSLHIISSKIPEAEGNYLPTVCNFIVSLPDIFELRITVINLIGKLGKWISNHSTIFNTFLNYLMNCLSNPRMAVSSSRSIMQLLIPSSGKISIPVESILNVMNDLNISGKLVLQAELSLIEGICASISHLSSDIMFQFFWRLVEPIYNVLKNLIETRISKINNNIINVNSKEGKKEVLDQIEKLTVAFRNIQIPGPLVLEGFLKVFPVIKLSIEIFPTDSVCEKLCRFYKHSIRSCGMSIVDHLEDLISHITVSFQKCPFSGFIYCGSILISDYSKYQNGLYVETLYKMVWSISNTFFAKYSNIENFIQGPDVVEEYFHFISKVLRYCPGNFVMATNEAKTIIQAAITALQLEHREAQKAVLLFFETLVQLNQSNNSNDVVENQSRLLINECGGIIVEGIFLLLSATWSAFAIDERDGCIGDVLWNLKIRYQQSFQVWIRDICTRLSADAIEEATKLNLIENLTLTTDKRDFLKLVDNFEYKCNRRK